MWTELLAASPAGDPESTGRGSLASAPVGCWARGWFTARLVRGILRGGQEAWPGRLWVLREGRKGREKREGVGGPMGSGALGWQLPGQGPEILVQASSVGVSLIECVSGVGGSV